MTGITEMPAETYHLFRRLHDQTKAELREKIARGEPIDEGNRHDVVYIEPLKALYAGATDEQALERALEVNQTFDEPYPKKTVRRHWLRAVRWAAAHPSPEQLATAKARAILNGQRPAPVTPSATRKGKRVLLRCTLSGVRARRVGMVVPGIGPAGTLILVAGIGGLGKTGYVLALSARVTQEGRDVLIVSYEDATAEVLRPRAEAAGADLDRLHVVSIDALEGGVRFPTDLQELDRHVRETNAALVLIDPVSASIDLKLDAHRDQDVRVVLGQLAKLAEREQVAIFENAHLNKTPSSDPYLRVNGSTAFYNSARSVLTVTSDPADPDWQRLIAHHKFNYGPLAPVERWRVVPVMVMGPDGPIETMKLQFVEIAADVSREDVLVSRSSAAEKLDNAVNWLESALADGEWHDSTGLKALAHASNKISKRTLERAAEELELEHGRRGFPSSTWWKLPQSRQPLSQNLGATGESA